ncbi:MAG: hypothetical protein L0Y39_04005, partial [Methylococcaceae bacterium]|nr:hypothetical protein [Methylococcaceae bacterium]
RKLAEDTVSALEMNYGGVDIMCDAQGRYSVIEVNSIPAWKGLESVAKIDIARMLADDFLGLCPDSRGDQAAVL